ncbi:MAG: tetratricopeptide repeat protein, partial [Gemmatimonadales bacterium]
DIITDLSKASGLLVIARNSSFTYTGKSVDIRTVGRELGVTSVLEGSVRRAGDRVRITAQLIDARSDTHMWSDTWDRSLDDIFAIQDEIAADVVAQLKVTLVGESPTVEETDPEAYALYLQARQLGRRGSVESVEQSIALYEQALEIEPDYAAAWAGLARNYTFQVAFVPGVIDEGIRLAREAANRALAIDPEYAPAYATLSGIASAYDNDLATAAQHLERALALEPTNPDIIGAAAGLVRKLGRLDEAIALREYAVARDPVTPGGHFGLGWTYVDNGRPGEAVASFRTLLSLSPGRIGTQESIGTALLYMGEPEAALSAMQQESEEGFRLIGLARAYHALGQASESDAALAELIEIEENEPGWAYNIAYVLAYRGEADRAFEWLDTAVEYNDSGLWTIPGSIQFANIHDDPRWLPFLESIGKSPEQLAAIEFEVRLPQ